MKNIGSLTKPLAILTIITSLMGINPANAVMANQSRLNSQTSPTNLNTNLDNNLIAQSKTCKVNTPKGGALNIREKASTKSKVITALKNKSPFTLKGVSKNKQWAQISTRRGKTGWVVTKYIKCS